MRVLVLVTLRPARSRAMFPPQVIHLHTYIRWARVVTVVRES